MPENQLFEYAVIRVVPHVEREEFINVGVVLYCGPQKFLKTKIHIDEARLKVLCSKVDIPEIQKYIDSFQEICRGGEDGGPIGKLPIAERFRWLTAARSTVLQTSKVHPGLCNDPEEMIERLYKQLVLLP
jgi:hypothetical protein